MSIKFNIFNFLRIGSRLGTRFRSRTKAAVKAHPLVNVDRGNLSDIIRNKTGYITFIITNIILPVYGYGLIGADADLRVLAPALWPATSRTERPPDLELDRRDEDSSPKEFSSEK